LRWVDLSIPSAWENDGVLWPELLIWKFGMDSDLSLEVNRIFAQAASNFKLNLMVDFVTFGAWPFLIRRLLPQACGHPVAILSSDGFYNLVR
jgi:hypothetical protein